MLRSAVLLLFLISRVCYGDAGSPRIAVVGAGASGIAAASKLLENGFQDVVVLEAEDRIGGRVHTVKFDEYTIDMGAQWIHGEKGNVAYDMAAPLNLTDHSGPYKLTMFTSSGDKLDPVIIKNLTDHYIEDLDSAEDLLAQGCNSSMGECFEKKMKVYFDRIPELNDSVKNDMLWHLNLMQTSLDPGDTWYDVSADDYEQYQMCEGDRAVNWKERGYSTILDILMRKFPNPEEELPVMNNTVLNAEVTMVDYSSGDGTVKLTTLDGKDYVVDHVIMTPSLGVLKAQHETLFHPPLPESKIRNIKGLGFGNACKIFLSFNDTWFNPDGDKNAGYGVLWTEEERKQLDSNPKTRWQAYILEFVLVEHKPRLFGMWISGKGARLMDDLTDEEVFDQTVKLITDVFSKHFNISMPTAIIRSKWHQNKHFRGTYSFRSMETVSTNSSARQLAEPIVKMGKPVVLFGGEATNSHYFSTVHGAIETGWREAERLMNLYSKNNDAAEKN